jgi:hypothetical protein
MLIAGCGSLFQSMCRLSHEVMFVARHFFKDAITRRSAFGQGQERNRAHMWVNAL